MKRFLSIVLALMTVLLAAFVAWHDLPRAAAEGPSAEAIPEFNLDDSARGLLASKHTQQFLGARSCAAVACHGRVSPSPQFALSRRNEYVAWLDHDPHARAYQTLAKPESEKILRRLETIGPDGERTLGENVLANCYGCHNPQPAISQQSATFFQRDGVSCEMCHGPAEAWIGQHVSAGWAQKTPAAKKLLGFLDTGDPLIRATTCAECHVGSPNREVNHDLIAAGHPALKFEFAAYHDALPKHWRDADERKQNRHFELKLWSAGQIASAETALRLLQWRAASTRDEKRPTVWPEFAEYDCYACHHDLVHPSWRQQLPSTGQTSGMAAWGGWYFSMPRQMTHLGTGHLGDWNASLQKLTGEMQAGFRSPDAALRQAIEDALSPLQAVESMPREQRDVEAILAGDVRGTFAALADEMEASPGGSAAWPTSWDEAAQFYAALVAVEQSIRNELAKQGQQLPEGHRTGLEALRNKLVFRDDFDSAKDFFSAARPEESRAEFVKSLAELIRGIEELSNLTGGDATE